MKCLTIFLHAAYENEVVDCLRGAESVSGFSLSDCRGHSRHTSDDPFAAARDRVEGFVPRVRLEVFLEDGLVDGVLKLLEHCAGGIGGAGAMGAWFVSEVGRSGRL